MFRSVHVPIAIVRLAAAASRATAIAVAAALAFALGYFAPQVLSYPAQMVGNSHQGMAGASANNPVARQSVLEDDFTSAIKTEKFWNAIEKGQKSAPTGSSNFDPSGRSGLSTAPFWSPFGPVPDSLAETHRQFDQDGFVSRTTYRTVCVRLCDGFYFPISYATTSDRFDDDETKCRSTCGTSARLYFYPNDGGEPEDMRDRSGRAYMSLETAFLYRTKYDAACTCQPQPWSDKAKARHELYALFEAKAAGSQTASADIKKLFTAHPELRGTTLAANAEKIAQTGGLVQNENERAESNKVRYAERHDASAPLSTEAGSVAGSKVVTDFADPIQPLTLNPAVKEKRPATNSAKKETKRENRRSKPTAQDVFRSNLMGSTGF